MEHTTDPAAQKEAAPSSSENHPTSTPSMETVSALSNTVSAPAPISGSGNGNQTKTAFWLGLLAGVAAMSIIGLIIVVVILLKGGLATKPIVDIGGKTGTETGPGPGNPPGPVTLKPIKQDDHWIGKFDSKVQVVTFTDLQCPFCKRFEEASLKQAIAEYKDRVLFVSKHFPLENIHPYAKRAGEAAECAGEQGKFFEYSSAVFAQQDKLNDAFLPEVAKQLKLDEKKFSDCLNAGKYRGRVEAEIQEGFEAGVEGTPATYVNGNSVYGAVPYADLKAMIEAELNK